jgi:hypothetical protein
VPRSCRPGRSTVVFRGFGRWICRTPNLHRDLPWFGRDGAANFLKKVRFCEVLHLDGAVYMTSGWPAIGVANRARSLNLKEIVMSSGTNPRTMAGFASQQCARPIS